MKVLVVSTSFPISVKSTSGIFVKRLVDALSKKIEVQVVVPDGRQQTESSLEYPVHCFRYAPKSFQTLSHEPGGLPVAIKESSIRAFLLPSYLLFFFLAIWRSSRGVDVIHANWSLPGVLAGIVGKLRKIPVVTTLRGDDVSHLGSSRVRQISLQLLLKWNSRILTVSASMARELSDIFWNSTDKFLYIPNGVDSDFLSASRHQESATALKIVCVGSLIKRKRIETAIEALALVRGNATLTIVGDGPEKQYLYSKVAELGLADRVSFIGAVPPSQVAEILCRHDALVLCSRSEGRPNVVLEAMASGRVVISTALPGVVELIEHKKTGLLFPIGDTKALTKNIEKLIQNSSSRVSLGNAAKGHIINCGYTWENSSKRYCQVYQSAMNAAGRKR